MIGNYAKITFYGVDIESDLPVKYIKSSLKVSTAERETKALVLFVFLFRILLHTLNEAVFSFKFWYIWHSRAVHTVKHLRPHLITSTLLSLS